jgi:hypothetical protein
MFILLVDPTDDDFAARIVIFPPLARLADATTHRRPILAVVFIVGGAPQIACAMVALRVVW